MLIPAVMYLQITGKDDDKTNVKKVMDTEAGAGRFEFYRKCDGGKQAELVDRFHNWAKGRLPPGYKTCIAVATEEVSRQLLRLEIQAMTGDEILSMLQLTDVFSTTDEPKVREATRDKFVVKYAGSRGDTSLVAFDKKGNDFALDLVKVIEQDGDPELRFAAVGCQGTCAYSLMPQDNSPIYAAVRAAAAPHQREVAAGMVQWHLRNRRAKPAVKSFGFLLGDNFYDCGLSTTDRRKLLEVFEKVYWKLYRVDPSNKEHEINWFAILGNHDYNFHGQAAVPSDAKPIASKFNRAMLEVDHTYEDSSHQWHLPYRYYCLTSSVANFFMIDSMTLLFDREQQEWFKRTYRALNNGRTVWNFLMSHHGYVSYGERGCQTSIKHPGDLGQVKKVMKPPKAEAGHTSGMSPMRSASAHLAGNLNSYLFDWVRGSGMHFDFNVAAHDHFAASGLLSYRHDARTYHTYFVLAGAGGASLHEGKLEALYQLKRNCNYDILEKDYGFVSFEVRKDEVVFRYHFKGHKFGDDDETSRTFYRATNGGFYTGGKGAGAMVAKFVSDVMKTSSPFAKSAYESWARDGLPRYLVQPTLRGVFYKRGEGGKLHSYDYKRRYFQLTWGETNLYYSPKPKTGSQIIDLKLVTELTRTGHQTITVEKESFDSMDVFELKQPKRTWVLAIPEEQAEDWELWIREGMKAGRH